VGASEVGPQHAHELQRPLGVPGSGGHGVRIGAC
jgi:hypothetical protein